MRKSVLLLASLAALAGFQAAANVKMPSIFSDNMVIQRDTKATVWGWADPGEEVTVTFNGQTVKAAADAKGGWQVELAPMKAGTPYVMTVKGKNTLTFKNAAVGEVWICSGQSNMEWRTQNVNNAAQELKAANYPNIRIFNGNTYCASIARQNDIPGRRWVVCAPNTIGPFSAVGYFFAREVYKVLQVPVGLIGVNWGGTRIEPWVSEVGFKDIPSLRSIYNQVKPNVPGTPEHAKASQQIVSDMEKWIVDARKAAAEKKQLPDLPKFPNGMRLVNHQQPTVLFNNMIAPLLKYSFRGMLWYQGCSNMGDTLYKDKMKALAASWRKEFNYPSMPLYFVQLAPFNYGNPFNLPVFWEGQQKFADEDKNAHMAVINDIGNFRDIHPRNKQDVGYRLALLALKYTYGKQDLVADSPFFDSLKVEGSKAIVTFRNAKQLKTKDGKAPLYFEITGLDGRYLPAKVVLDGNKAILTHEKITSPKGVRYAWNQNITTNLVNENNLPAGSFRASLPIQVREHLDSLVPEAKKFKVLYAMNAKNLWNGVPVYRNKDAGKIQGKIKKIGYFMYLSGNDGKMSYVFATVDPFTQDVSKLGLPTANPKVFFQQFVKNLTVKSNVPGVKNGTFPDGNIEFWSGNYGTGNAAKVPGASDVAYDFGDSGDSSSNGYGSMQLHNYKEKQTVFAMNNFRAGNNVDIGIGNRTGGNPDYTFSNSAKNYTIADLLVLVELE